MVKTSFYHILNMVYFFIFRHIHNMGGKSSSQMVRFLYHMFANCVLVKWCWPKLVHVCEEFLKSLQCSTGQFECGFATLPNFFVSFWKGRFFLKKVWFFFQNRLTWQIWCRMGIKWFHFFKMYFPPELWFSAKKKIRIFIFGKINEFDEETVSFWKKNAFIFLKSIFNKIGGLKKCRC